MTISEVLQLYRLKLESMIVNGMLIKCIMRDICIIREKLKIDTFSNSSALKFAAMDNRSTFRNDFLHQNQVNKYQKYANRVTELRKDSDHNLTDFNESAIYFIVFS